MQVDFEELKEKVKYEGGRFLNNERKENEIIILRQENDILKKEISKLEKNNKINDFLNKDYLNKIKKLENEIELLKKQINEFQELNNKKNENNENIKNNNNINNNNDNTLSKWFNKHDIENVNNIIPNSLSKRKNLNCLISLKSIFPKSTLSNNKRPANYNIIKNLYMNSNNSMKNNINLHSSTMSTINTNNPFTSNYNKIINNIKHKTKRQNINKKYESLKQNNKNNSMKIEKEEDKSLSINKYLKSNNEKYLYKSDRKKINTNNFNKVIKYKSIINYPLSCKHKTSSKLTKYKNKKMGFINNYNELKIIKNNSALNIRINSK